MWVPVAFIGFISIINGPLWSQVKYGKAITNIIAENIPITLILPSRHHMVDISWVLLCWYVYENPVFQALCRRNVMNVCLGIFLGRDATTLMLQNALRNNIYKVDTMQNIL